MEAATSIIANTASPPMPLLAFLASVGTLSQPTAPPASNSPAQAISTFPMASVHADLSHTFQLEPVLLAAIPIVLVAPAPPVLPVWLNIIPVALLALLAQLTVIPAILVDASPAPQATSRAAELVSRRQPPSQSAFPALAQQSSVQLDAPPATWTRAVN